MEKGRKRGRDGGGRRPRRGERERPARARRAAAVGPENRSCAAALRFEAKNVTKRAVGEHADAGMGVEDGTK